MTSKALKQAVWRWDHVALMHTVHMFADAVVSLMVMEQSWSVREACCQAIAATRRILVVKRLTAAKRLLTLLAEWARVAEKQDRLSLLRALLRALRRLDLKYARHVPRTLSKALQQLHKHRQAGAAAQPERKTVTLEVGSVEEREFELGRELVGFGKR